MKFTDNYNLNLPDKADQYNLQHWNENTSKIDEQLKTDENNLNSHKSDFGNPHQVKGSQLTEPVPTEKIADNAVTESKINKGAVNTFDKLSEDLQNLLFPAGKTEYLSFVPTSDWLKKNRRIICDGSAVLRNEYPRLFSAIGTTFGVGDGTTTFNLPNYIGRLLYGSSTSVTTKGGSESVTLTTSNLPSHNHSMSHTHALNVTQDINYLWCNGPSNNIKTGASTQSMQGLKVSDILSIGQYTGNTGTSGSGTAVNVMNPYCTAIPVITF